MFSLVYIHLNILFIPKVNMNITTSDSDTTDYIESDDDDATELFGGNVVRDDGVMVDASGAGVLPDNDGDELLYGLDWGSRTHGLILVNRMVDSRTEPARRMRIFNRLMQVSHLHYLHYLQYLNYLHYLHHVNVSAGRGQGDQIPRPGHH